MLCWVSVISPLRLNNIPMYMHHILFIYPSSSGYWVASPVATVNDAAMNTVYIQLSGPHPSPSSAGCVPQSGMAGSAGHSLLQELPFCFHSNCTIIERGSSF